MNRSQLVRRALCLAASIFPHKISGEFAPSSMLIPTELAAMIPETTRATAAGSLAIWL
jgi:hypothetical protein